MNHQYSESYRRFIEEEAEARAAHAQKRRDRRHNLAAFVVMCGLFAGAVYGAFEGFEAARHAFERHTEDQQPAPQPSLSTSAVPTETRLP